MTNKPSWLIERDVVVDDQTVLYSYDTEGDILEIIFQKGGGMSIDLTENITLRFDRETGRALSLIFVSFSRLLQPTKYGPASFPLNALAELPSDLQEAVLTILHRSPVNHFLKISGIALTPGGEPQPITQLDQPNEIISDMVLA